MLGCRALVGAVSAPIAAERPVCELNAGEDLMLVCRALVGAVYVPIAMASLAFDASVGVGLVFGASVGVGLVFRAKAITYLGVDVISAGAVGLCVRAALAFIEVAAGSVILFVLPFYNLTATAVTHIAMTPRKARPTRLQVPSEHVLHIRWAVAVPKAIIAKHNNSIGTLVPCPAQVIPTFLTAVDGGCLDGEAGQAPGRDVRLALLALIHIGGGSSNPRLATDGPVKALDTRGPATAARIVNSQITELLPADPSREVLNAPVQPPSCPSEGRYIYTATTLVGVFHNQAVTQPTAICEGRAGRDVALEAAARPVLEKLPNAKAQRLLALDYLTVVNDLPTQTPAALLEEVGGGVCDTCTEATVLTRGPVSEVVKSST